MKILPIQQYNKSYSKYGMPSFNAKAVYPGSFDQITNGHMDIIKRAGKMFDSLTILVAKNPDKQGFLPIMQRIPLIKKALKDLGLKNVTVDTSEGITVNYAKSHGIDAMVRGLRNDKDFEYEMDLYNVNSLIEPEVDTVFIPTNPNTKSISSSIVREVYKLGGNLSKMVPENAAAFLSKPEYLRYFEGELYSVLAKLGADDNFAEKTVNEITSKYGDKSRGYHGTNHITSMLKNIEEFLQNSKEANKLKNIDEFKFAVFMHDFINGEKDDVKKSAENAEKILKEIDGNYDTAYIKELITATDYSVSRRDLTFDQRLMRDLDLSILGENPDKYKEYSKQIREQYSQYSDEEFGKARKDLLLSFAQTPVIYNTEYFRRKYENQARVNLLNEISKL